MDAKSVVGSAFGNDCAHVFPPTVLRVVYCELVGRIGLPLWRPLSSKNPVHGRRASPLLIIQTNACGDCISCGAALFAPLNPSWTKQKSHVPFSSHKFSEHLNS